MELQTIFYIVGIIFMSLMLILFIALVAAVFVIRAKINAIHQQIEQKLSVVTGLASKGADVVTKVRDIVTP